MTDAPSRCGFVAIVGRPNVGKSTLLNHLLEQKISITSRKPQTTRHAVTGIKTEGVVQMVFVDTPGIHKDQPRAINRVMNRAANTAMADVDVIVWVLDRTVWTDADAWVGMQIQATPRARLIIAINKIDQLADKSELLARMQALQTEYNPAAIVPISALRSQQLTQLQAEIEPGLPEGPHQYEMDEVTDRPSRFFASELVREKIMRQMGAEVPYQVAVEIEHFKDMPGIIDISALILVEKSGQKRIIIGEKGDRLKQVGREARLDMEQMFGKKVMLRLWIKVKSGWADDERALKSLGMND